MSTPTKEQLEFGPDEAWYSICDLLDELDAPGWLHCEGAPIDFVLDALRAHFAPKDRP